jgi:hypothetical protein
MIFYCKAIPKDGSALSELLTSDDDDYCQYFIPLHPIGKVRRKGFNRQGRIATWTLVWRQPGGFFMMRGFDEGISVLHSACTLPVHIRGRASKLALEYCMNWCRMNDIDAMMLKVHPITGMPGIHMKRPASPSWIRASGQVMPLWKNDGKPDDELLSLDGGLPEQEP